MHLNMGYNSGTFGVAVKSAAVFISSRWPRHAGGNCIRSLHPPKAEGIHSGQHTASPHSSVPHLPHHLHQAHKPKAAETSDPLQILFCGSDEFSCTSLEALHKEHIENPALVRSINVVLRPSKPTGRGYKSLRDPPIRGLAKKLGLQIHEKDTFTGWSMPSGINLIVAVSFGLFVPPRLLSAAKYGGLNLHPSLLPDLRGPAPLQHTLLTGRTLSGVSLQTLDHKNFDHGMVLAQTPADPKHKDALRVPQDCTTVDALQALVAPVAAHMLVHALRAGLHVPPLEERGWAPDPTQRSMLVHAPKITKKDRQITLATLRECDNEPPGARGTLSRRQDAIGPLWFWSRDREGARKRIIIEELEEMTDDQTPIDRRAMIHEGLPNCRYPDAYDAKTHGDNYIHRRPCLIPFEEGEGSSARPIPSRYLVLWNTAESTGSGDISGEMSRASSQYGLCLGKYRVLSVKVEGAKAKPASLALHRFFIHDARPHT
ncbi:Formyltransferase [Poronia punctata]|nr:Formyltransferase [Poronia punctata]